MPYCGFILGSVTTPQLVLVRRNCSVPEIPGKKLEFVFYIADRTGPHRIMAPKSKVLSSLQGGLGLAKANELPMVLVMGMTGAGKSHFINKLANRHVVEEGDDYDSCTSQDCALKLIFITGRRVGLQKSQY